MGAVIVIGAGMTGLSLAWRLAREGRDVVVLEASERVGGVIRSERRDGVLIEHAAQSLPSTALESLALAEAVGLKDHVLAATPAAKNRYILWEGRLRSVPRGLLDGGFMPRRGLLRALAEPLVPRREPPRLDETVFAFAQRRFGRAVAERLVDPFVAGVYAGDPHTLEVAAAFPDWTEAEAEAGSVVLGMIRKARRRKRPDWAPRTLFSFRDGMESLPNAIAVALGERVRLRASVERIEHAGSSLRVFASGGPYDAQSVIVCVAPHRAAAFVPELQSELAAMPQVRVASVHLAWPDSEVPEPCNGFGWLAPTRERQDVLGALWISSAFPAHAPGRSLIRVMLGGARDPRLPADPELLADRARRILREVQRIEAPPSLTHVAINAIPQYDRGHGARCERLRQAIPGLHFLGWGYTGVGVEHCVRAAGKHRV